MTDPLHRTNINLYESDVRFLERHFGYGWTERIREWVREKVREIRELDLEPELDTEPTDE